MNSSYRIRLRNTSGVSQHREEIRVFTIEQMLDIMLISETHFIERSLIRIPVFTIYTTRHPDGSAYDGNSVLL